jgi:8-oxo-dGTP diphosphatase
MRHASAGDRLPSPSEDRARRLDRTGRKDARMLPRVLAEHAIDRIVTSPHARSLETVEPIARARGLEIECREALAPDASRVDTVKLLEGLPESALVCTHREVIERLFDGEIRCEKGGTWVLEPRHGRRVPVEYLPPPSVIPRERTRLVC